MVSGVAAGADGRIASRDQGTGGNIGDAVVAVGAREYQGAAAVFDKATPTGGAEIAALEHVSQVKLATGVDRDAVVVPVQADTHADGRDHATAGRDLLIAVKQEKRTARVVIRTARDGAAAEEEVGDAVGKPVRRVHIKHRASVQGHGGHIARRFAVPVDSAEDPLVVGVKRGPVIHDDRARAQGVTGGLEGARVEDEATREGVVPGKHQCTAT